MISFDVDWGFLHGRGNNNVWKHPTRFHVRVFSSFQQLKPSFVRASLLPLPPLHSLHGNSACKRGYPTILSSSIHAFFASSSSVPASRNTTHDPLRKHSLTRSPLQVAWAYQWNTGYTSGLRAFKGETATPLPAVDILEDDYGHHLHARIPSTGPESLRSASKSKLGHQNRVFQHLLQHRWGHPATPL